ncbi:hypothetical protein GcM3_111017, partial [Golovinomyces cichoracearum]
WENLHWIVEAFPINQLKDPLTTSRYKNSYARAVKEVQYLIAYLPTLRAELESPNPSSFSQNFRLAYFDSITHNSHQETKRKREVKELDVVTLSPLSLEANQENSQGAVYQKKSLT